LASGDEAKAEVEVAATAAGGSDARTARMARKSTGGAEVHRRQGAATRRATGETATGGEG